MCSAPLESKIAVWMGDDFGRSSCHRSCVDDCNSVAYRRGLDGSCTVAVPICLLRTIKHFTERDQEITVAPSDQDARRRVEEVENVLSNARSLSADGIVGTRTEKTSVRDLSGIH